MIYEIDDGSLDTVLKCSDCGAVFRYNFLDHVDSNSRLDTGDAELDYAAFVKWAIVDVTFSHICPEDFE